ncbi:MAG: hypothetical protein K0B11_07830 [Mariniphaga sp.]|nr:hypothetical protein [Mariniphaga sp.]
MKALKYLFVATCLLFTMVHCREKEFTVVFDQVSFSFITHTTVIANVKLKSLNSGAFRFGVVYSVKPIPTINDFSSDDFFSDPLNYSIGVSGLEPGTTYYFRPFIESAEGLFYGESFTFQTLSPEWHTDPRDGQKYLIRNYGTATWMIQNLNYHLPGSKYYFNDSIKYAQEFGRLYTYNQVIDACPPGWKLPSPNDWNTLIEFCGSTNEKAIEAMVEPGKRLWAESQQYIRNNSSGFTIKPSGALTIESESESFPEKGYSANFWSKTDDGIEAQIYSYAPHLSSHFVNTVVINSNLTLISIRCIKDN